MEGKNMNISGTGTIKSNIYDEEIHISGSGRIEGDVRCQAIHASGVVYSSGNVECSGGIHISGAGRFGGDVSCSEMRVSGAVSAENVKVRNDVRISGTIKTSGSVKCNEARISGKAECASFEAENFKSSGEFRIDGLLNVGTADIKLSRGFGKCTAGSIGGTTIRVEKSDDSAIRLFNVFSAGKYAALTVTESIEGDEIYLENTECPLVIGKRVFIGEGCKIDRIQYTEICEANINSHVGDVRKI